MGKLRADSTWSRLSPEQRRAFEGWFFDDNLGYQAARDKAEKEFGVSGSVDSVGRYYRRRAEERPSEESVSPQALASVMSASAADAATLRTAVQTAMGMRFLVSALDGGNVREMCALGRMMLDTERSELLRERVELARDRQGLSEFELAQRFRELAGKPEGSGNSAREVEGKMPVNAGNCG